MPLVKSRSILNWPVLMVGAWLLPTAWAGDATNPWVARVPQAIAQAHDTHTPAAYREALIVAWRADAWPEGLKLAREAQEQWPNHAETLGPVVRAYLRAGRLLEAEDLAKGLSIQSSDHIALRTLANVHLMRGELAAAAAVAKRIAALGPQEAEDYFAIFTVHFAQDEYGPLPGLLHEVEQHLDAAHGYPEMYVEESIAGLADYLRAVGTEPLNRITQYGAVKMTPLLVGLPACDVLINGRGPYRMVVDTGGSIMLSLDQAVADELGIKSVADATIRGVSGTSESGQVVIDELTLGTIRCERVIGRTFDVRSAIMGAADGIIGTGIFHRGRMTLDFNNAQLVIAPSSAEPAAGETSMLRLVGDAKLFAPVQLEGEPGAGFIDSGADIVAMSPRRLRALFPDQKPLTVPVPAQIGVGNSAMPQISFSRGVRLDFGGRTLPNIGGVGLDVLDTTLGPVLGVQADVILGMGVLRQMGSLTVDFPQCKMWIDWLAQN